jgi:chromosome segregation ATPase
LFVSLSIREITSKLRKKVKKLTKAMDVFKSESEGEMQEIKSSHESEKIKWQTEYDELQSDLEIAGIELASAREEATNLGKEIKLLEKNMNELEALLLGQIEEVTTRKDNEISDIKVEAEDVRLTLVKEIEELEQQLSESELCSENLLQDLEEAKMELTNELISFKEKTKKELDAVQQSLKARDMDVASRDDNIETLESERTSLRKLFRLQGSLVKKRIRKRFRGEK